MLTTFNNGVNNFAHEKDKHYPPTDNGMKYIDQLKI